MKVLRRRNHTDYDIYWEDDESILQLSNGDTFSYED